MMPPLLQNALDAGLQTYPTASDDTKKYELPPRMLLMLRDELVNLGFDLPQLWPGDCMTLELYGIGTVELHPTTVH